MSVKKKEWGKKEVRGRASRVGRGAGMGVVG